MNSMILLVLLIQRNVFLGKKLKLAVDKGMADDDPTILDKFVGDYVFNPKYGQQAIPIGEPVEVLEIGTGMMMIRKEALKKFKEFYPQYMYKPDHARTEHFDGSREILMYFQCEIDRKSKRYFSEDYWFCQKAQEAGLRTWLCPWMKTQHVGSYIFSGSLADLASIGAAATVDPSQLKKGKQGYSSSCTILLFLLLQYSQATQMLSKFGAIAYQVK